MSYFSGKSVMITGGAGFIGSHLVDALVSTQAERICVVDDLFLGRRENLSSALGDERVQFVELDATQGDAISEIISREKIDTIFNLAVIPLPASLERPRWSSEVNIDLTLSLCELQRAGAFADLVHFSSSEAYGTAQTIPMNENHPLLPTTPYAASKAAADHLVHGYMQTFGLNAMTIRPFNNYGPRQNMREYAGIIPTVLSRLDRQEPIVIFGDGQQTRDYIYAPDTAAITLRIVESDRAWGETVNLASGREISMLDLVAKLAELTGKKADIDFRPDRPGDVRRLLADVSKAENIIGEPLPLIDFEQGLRETVQWYQQELARGRISEPGAVGNA